MKKILCDLCKRDIKEEKDIWYIQIPFYVNGKLIGEFGSYLGYKIIELCPTCADSFARCIKEQMKELGMEI